MTKRQINISLKKIEKSKDAGCFVEALLIKYHLNIDMLKFISSKLYPDKITKNIKVKEVLNNLIPMVNNHASTKAVISKKNLKILKPWLNKMDLYFKTLKIKDPSNTKSLLAESAKIFALLNISLAKIFIDFKP